MVDEVLALTFLGGKRLMHTHAASAGNVAVAISPAALKRWRILFGRFRLTCDATVANRQIAFHLTDGAVITFTIGKNNTAIVASTTQYVNVVSGSPLVGLDFAKTDLATIPLPNPCIIEGADQFVISVLNGVAGDAISGYLVVLEL